ncbi:hypothetical protein Tco_0639901 [Tanacetum coccineum]
MPYPSRKIRRIYACTLQRPRRKQDPIRCIQERQYAVFKLYGNKIFWKISNVVPTLRNPQYTVIRLVLGIVEINHYDLVALPSRLSGDSGSPELWGRLNISIQDVDLEEAEVEDDDDGDTYDI